MAASDWIYQNVPGPINVRIQAADGSTFQQPLPFSSGTYLQSSTPFQTSFISRQTGS